MWDTQSLKMIDVMHGHDGIVHNLVFSNGLLVSSSDDQTIRVSTLCCCSIKIQNEFEKIDIICFDTVMGH
jgi:WD40 repeat protein